MSKVCSITGCGAKHRAHGLCVKHYKAQWFKNQYVPKEKNVCNECGAKHWGKKELCPACDERAYAKSQAREGALRKYAQSEAFKRTQERWRLANPQKKRALTNAYRARLRRQTPPWADMDRIKQIYELAQTESERTGQVIEVDHIFPLRGKTFSGLHVDYNLQLLPKPDNCRKGNRIAQ